MLVTEVFFFKIQKKRKKKRGDRTALAGLEAGAREGGFGVGGGGGFIRGHAARLRGEGEV